MEYKKHRFNIYPPMQPEEFDRLREDIFVNGYKEDQPIWLYEGEIIDGWNRYQACLALGITPPVRNFHGSDLDAVQFIIRTNNRRDLNSSQRAAIAIDADALVAMLQEEAKKRYIQNVGRPSKNKSPELIPEIYPDLTPAEYTEKVETAHRSHEERAMREVRTQLAQTFGTNNRYVSDVAKIKREDPEAFEAIKSGVKTITAYKAELMEANKPKAHVSNNSGENEWYTPEEYILAARAVMGCINLDPASCETANAVVMADKYYTAQDDGLTKKWHGKVWINPPYSQPLIARFCEKVVDEFCKNHIEEALVLVNNATETTWFQLLASEATAICFPKSRVKFWAPDKKIAAPLQGQAVLYFSDLSTDSIERFSNVFSKFGFVTICK